MKNIVFFDTKEYEKEYFIKHLSEKFNLVFEDYSLLPETTIPDIAIDTEIISVFTSSRLTEKILSQFKELKLIATRSVGYSHIDLDYCKEHNIKIVNTPHYGDYTVAEFSFGLLLNLIRKICKASTDLKDNQISNNYEGMELFGKTIGIIGTGGIGSKSLKIASGFSMNLLAYDIHPNEQLVQKFNVKFTDLDTLVKESDIISLHAPANTSNYHMLDKQRFDEMKDSTVIINTGRGELIDTQALYNALKEKKIAGAALDVLEYEEAITNNSDYFIDDECIDTNYLKKTLINHKLLSLPNVIITPHIAYDTKEAVTRILEITVNNIIAFSNNYGLENQVI